MTVQDKIVAKLADIEEYVETKELLSELCNENLLGAPQEQVSAPNFESNL